MKLSLFSFGQIDTLETYYLYEHCTDSSRMQCWLGESAIMYFTPFNGGFQEFNTPSEVHLLGPYYSRFDTTEFSNIITIDSSYRQGWEYTNFFDLSKSKSVEIKLELNQNTIYTIDFPDLDRWLQKRRNQLQIYNLGYNFNSFEYKEAYLNLTSKRVFSIFKVKVIVDRTNDMIWRNRIDYSKKKCNYNYFSEELKTSVIIDFIEIKSINDLSNFDLPKHLILNSVR